MARPYSPDSGGVQEWEPPVQGSTYAGFPAENRGSGPTTPPPGYIPVARRVNRGQRVTLILLGVFILAMGGLIGYALLTAKHVSASAGSADGSHSLDVFSLTMGQCFDEPSGATVDVSSIDAIPCSKPHDAEVIGVYTLSDATYNASAISTEANNACQTMSQNITVDQSKLGDTAGIIDFTPTSDDWNNEDHTVTCAVDNGPGNKLVGSVLK